MTIELTPFGVTHIALAEALLRFSDYNDTHSIADIDRYALQGLRNDYWDWHSKASELCGDDETLEDLCFYSRRTLEYDYVLSRMGAGTGLWDNYHRGAQLHEIARSQGYLEGLIEAANGDLTIF